MTRIGVFDSGVGGITVLAELRKRFPHAEYVYLGDTANLPYGSKSAAQIERLSRECARQLRSFEIDALVIACNTAAAHALEAVREEMGGIPVLGVVEPGVDAAMAALSDSLAQPSPVLVLATGATVRSGAYGRGLRARLGSAQLVVEQACPLFVPMIEEGWIDHPILEQTIREYVGPHVTAYGTGVALLGCTHYPWIQEAIQKALPGWKVINSAQAVADALEREGLASAELGALAPSPQVRWIFTDAQAVPTFARRWMEEVSSP